MFYSTHVRYRHSKQRSAIGSTDERKAVMTFALMLVLVLLLSSAYLFHQWYTDDLRDLGP